MNNKTKPTKGSKKIREKEVPKKQAPKKDWRKQHEELIAAVRAAKGLPPISTTSTNGTFSPKVIHKHFVTNTIIQS